MDPENGKLCIGGQQEIQIDIINPDIKIPQTGENIQAYFSSEACQVMEMIENPALKN